MKKRFTRIIAALALLFFMAPSMVAVGQTYTTVMECDLTTKSYGCSAYNTSTVYGDWTIVNGANNNKGWAYFKMGGKSATISDYNPCYIYSTAAASSSVDKITVHLPAGSLSKSGMSVNSWGVYVYSNAAMTTQIDYVAGGTITNSEGSFDFTPSTGVTWASGYYYKVSWDLANTTTTNGIVCVDKITLYKETSATATTTTIDATGITNTDVYVSTTAGSLSATVSAGGTTISGATVTWSGNNDAVATIDASTGTVTLVAAGTVTFTASYAGESGTYLASSSTYTLNVTDSTPFAGGVVTFVAGTDTGTSTGQNEDQMTKSGVTVHSTKAALATSEYRLYQNSITTISTTTGTITEIVFTGNDNSYPVSRLSVDNGNGTYTTNNNVGTWTGDATSASFTASAQARASQIAVTVVVSSAVATTTTINVPSDFNTDIYTSNTAGTLTATVSAEGTPISGATVTWSSSNTDVATIDANGAVTLVAAGTTTITASYAGVTDQYRPSADTYELEVTDSTPIADLVIDFESATTAYTNWTFTNMTSQQTGSITAHGGDYYGTTGSKTSASITTNSKIATPYTLTCYVSKQSTNTAASTWYIQVSSDGTTWTDVASRSAIDMNKGEWKEFSANLTEYTDVYVRVYYNGNSSTAVRNIDDLTLLTSEPSVIPPTFSPAEGFYTSAQNVTISTTTSGATIYYTLDGTDPTTSSSVYSSPINVSSTTTIKAMAVASGEASSIVSATYTIELPLSTMDQIFAKATEVGSTATTVYITLGNWVVTGANSSSHTFVSDGTKGFMIYQSDHGFSAGDILSGTVECKVQLYNGAAEITQLTSSTTGLTVTTGGTATVANIALADLTGINTGALVSYHNLTCEAREEGSYTNYYLSDGTTEIQAYKTLLNEYADYLEDGKKYNITGVFVLNNETKRINPRSAADIVEVSTYTLPITAADFTSNPATGYYFIASPVSENITPSADNGITSGNYDLYFWDEPAHTWRNYKQNSAGTNTNAGFSIENGKGYLYANQAGTTITFTGTPLTETSKAITLSKQNTTTAHGAWNLIGNPFTEAAYLYDANGGNRDYYIMRNDGSDVISATPGTAVAKMNGIFVIADAHNEVVTFSTTAPSGDSKFLALNINQNRGDVIDRAIVNFNEGSELPKLQLFESTKLYIPQDEGDYAVVNGNNQGTLPINFKATANGTYTLNIDTENVTFRTLILHDNLTGEDINLLAKATYSFEATTDDAEDRFTLVYSKSGETKTYKLTITAEDFTTTSYAANNNMKISNAVNVDDETDTYEVKWVSSQVYQNGDGQMQWKRGEGRIYNISNMGTITDVTVTDISGEFCTYYGDYIEPAFYGYDGWPFFQTKTLNDAVGVSEKLEVTFDIEEGVTPTSFTVTFDAGEGTFVGNEDFPSTENTMPAGIYTLPTATREGYVFNGWLAANSNTPKIDTYTVYTDVAFTAQYTENGASGGNGGVDVLNREFTGVTGTTYTNWSDMEGESGAVYAGNSAGGNDAIQLRSTNNAGIITTASGGMVSKVVVSWNSNTAAGRTLNVYGKNVAYEATSDLYNDNKQGALLGTIVKGTSTELTVSDEYTFIGMRSNSGAMYLDEISITWVLPSNVATPTFSPAGGTYTEAQSVTISCDTEDAVIYYTTDGTTPDNNSTVYDGAITVSETTTIQAIAYVGTEASLVASATYTIVTPLTIAAVREQGTGAVMTMGIVTAVSSNSNGTTAYMQDETAAIVVYGNFTAEVGDEIQVEGTLTTYKGLLEIGTPTVTVLSQDNVVDPTYMTIEEINNDAEGDNDYQAMLVNIIDATVTSVGSSNTIAQGTNTITVYGSLGEVEVNDVITFTGNIGCYNTVQIVNPTNIEVQSNLPVFLTEGGDWNVADNWSTGVVPTIEDDVVLNANVTITGIAEANSIQQLNYTITIEDGGQLKFNEGPVEATVKKFVQGYGAGNEDEAAGYKLIHNPIRVTNTNQIEGLLTGNYDVYYWDETADGEEWQNIEDDDTYFDWSYIHGFLYANEEDVTLSYTGTLYNNSVNSRYEVTYNSGHAFSGLNLIGNLFVCEAYLTNPNATEALPYYRMNENGDGLTAVNNATPIAPMEAIFYYQAEDWAWVDFNRMAPEDKGSNLNMVVSQGQGTVDNAIVSFNNTNTLEKFSFREGSTKLYIPQNGKEYAVVYSEGVGEMPVNFKAEKNDTYTLSFSNDNVEFSYLHLIDNLTGADVDLLANPSYSFEAKNSDYASRFKLVFATGNNSESNDFAYISDSNIIVNGEGMLQVIDMTGRIVSTEQINGMARVNVNAAAGVYVLQLTNGESVKTQKIVIK